MSVPAGVLPRRNWPAFLMFTTTTIAAMVAVPVVGTLHGYSIAAWIAFAVFLITTEMSITCGYHRLFAHGSYRAKPLLKAFFLLFGAMALQNSALNWSAGHRVHHRFLDDPELDPYCAKRGFWFSHIGWMLRNYPSGDPDLKYVRDLQKDPLVALEHRYYLWIAVGMNLGVPLLLGLVFHDVIGMLLLAGILRLVLSHQLTFCINSLAHIIGRRPYAITNTARDNGWVALLTFGEGYHNFHHRFAEDYRNGVRWWQWDPSKWLIVLLRYVGLAANLKRVSGFKIRRAMLETEFQLAAAELDRRGNSPWLDVVRQRVAHEYENFSKSVAAWAAVRSQVTAQGPGTAAHRRPTLRSAERGLREQYRRMRVIGSELRAARYVLSAARSA